MFCDNAHIGQTGFAGVFVACGLLRPGSHYVHGDGDNHVLVTFSRSHCNFNDVDMDVIQT